MPAAPHVRQPPLGTMFARWLGGRATAAAGPTAGAGFGPAFGWVVAALAEVRRGRESACA